MRTRAQTGGLVRQLTPPVTYRKYPADRRRTAPLLQAGEQTIAVQLKENSLRKNGDNYARSAPKVLEQKFLKNIPVKMLKNIIFKCYYIITKSAITSRYVKFIINNIIIHYFMACSAARHSSTSATLSRATFKLLIVSIEISARPKPIPMRASRASS